MISRRTKIVATLGPASAGPEKIRALLEAGMNVARINCSHGTLKEHEQTIRHVRSVASDLGLHVPVLLDLAGPKMRIGSFAKGSVTLEPGGNITLTKRPITGDGAAVSVNYPPLVDDVQPGDRVLMGDGEIELRVLSKTDTDVTCEVITGGELMSNKGINAPGVKLRERVPTKKDLEDVLFGIEQDVDWFALSFVRTVEETQALRDFIRENGSDIPIVVKLEKKEALDHLEDIMRSSDALMIARGDLGLEVPIEEVPLIQKDVIKLAIPRNKPVIIATQMLETMINNPRPTRAEAADVANAVFDGTDAVMLSGETAVGRYPARAVAMMSKLAAASESRIDYTYKFRHTEVHAHDSIPEAVAYAACHTAIETRAKLIICCTRTGLTASYVSRYHPPARIVAASPSRSTLARTMLFWNTHPVLIDFAGDTDRLIESAKSAVLETGLAEKGDRVVVVAGVPIADPGTTNMIKSDVL